MVLCIVGLVVFSVLGIFSAHYRALAREAFGCVFQTITLRPCTTGFDTKMKISLTTQTSKIHPRIGKALFNHFNLFSWALVLLMLVSFYWTATGIYNFAQFGNCNGPQSNAFCALSPETYGNIFSLFTDRPENIRPISLEGGNEIGPTDAQIQLLEVGCFSCPYSRAAKPWVDELLQKYPQQIRFSFKYLPIPKHEYSQTAAESAECAKDQGKYREYYDKLFEPTTECSAASSPTEAFLHQATQYATELGLDVNRFTDCISSREKQFIVDGQKHEAVSAGVYATPTFFINGKALVSPQTQEELFRAVEKALEEK